MLRTTSPLSGSVPGSGFSVVPIIVKMPSRLATTTWPLMSAEQSLPTKEEFEELVDRCSWELRVQKGKKGYTVTSNVNGNSIFLPLSGYWRGNHFGDGVGRYWTSSLRTEDPFDAYSIEFGYSPTFESDMIGWNSTSRSCGLTIRPVSDV